MGVEPPDVSCSHSNMKLLEYVEHPGGGATVVWECWLCGHHWQTHDEP
jgi:hypothetical protein